MNDDHFPKHWPQLGKPLALQPVDLRQTCHDLSSALNLAIPFLVESLSKLKTESGDQALRRREEILKILNQAQPALARAKRALRGVPETR